MEITKNPTFQTLDVRGLEPPQPMERVLDALSALPRSERLRMLIDREPHPLYPILEQRGYAHEATRLADGHYEVQIWRAASSSCCGGCCS